MKKTFFKVLFFNILILEALSFILIRFFYVEQPPKSYKQQFLPYFIDTDLSYSTWHYSDLTTRQIGPKWNVEYKFNSYGARDIERPKKSTKPRIVFLGDSFIEGYGIQQKSRLSDRLEKSLGIECLNFAVSGTGQTQMNLVYEDLATQFDHDLVFIGFYPFNDFRENSYSNIDKYFGNRYRPYRVKDSIGTYGLKYHLNKPEESDFHPSKYSEKSLFSSLLHTLKSDLKLIEKFKTIFFDFTYSGALIKGTLERTHHVITIKDAENFDIEKNDHHLAHTNKLDWEILEYELALLRQKSGQKPLILLLIPHPGDFSYRKSLGRKTPVQNKIAELSTKLNIHYVDFLEELPSNEVSKLYIKNDDHWSSYGNKKAHVILEKKLKDIYNFSKKKY